jgi:predicted membrane-bound spermidine synthase
MLITHIVRGFIKRLGLYEAIAFASGFVLMAYELAASRILAPTIGTSIYVWTSVIGVMIAALAIGYAAGGWIADRRSVAHDIAWLLIIAALGVTVTCVFSDAVLTTVAMVVSDVRIQGVIASAILFAPASFIMGMISPYLAKLRVNSLKSTGRSVAALSALNSLGGITGTFSAGFIFFNYIGSRETLALLAVLLLACSWLIVNQYRRRDRIIICIVVCSTLALQLASPVNASTVAEIDTPTSHYKIADVILDWRELRVLIMGPGGYQSGVYTSGSKDLAFNYTRKLADVIHAKPEKTRILILGGGAFTLPEYVAREYPDTAIDVIEIDTKLPGIAKQYFRYEPTANIHVIAEDARTYLTKTDKRYDVVVVDVYNDDAVPFSLATREYAASLKKIVQPNGVVAANIIAGANKECLPLLSSLNGTYRSAFSNARIYPLVDPKNRIKQNIIAIYGNTSLDWAEHLVGENTTVLPTGQKLTDNFAPTEHLIQKCI